VYVGSCRHTLPCIAALCPLTLHTPPLRHARIPRTPPLATTPHTQRTCEIWGFAISFAWRYWLLSKKWSYPKKAGGMTPAAVSARKQELAGVTTHVVCVVRVRLCWGH
jgi:hypothetical protein